MIDANKIVSYMMVEWIGVAFAVYFFYCASSPADVQALGLPVLFQGDLNYGIGVLAVLAFSMPLVMYLLRNAKKPE